MTIFARYLKTFLILHLSFAALLILALNLFSAWTNDLKAYLWWILIIFGVEGTLLQTIIFTSLSRYLTKTKTIFLIAMLVIELIFLNLFVLYHGNWKEFSGDSVLLLTSKSPDRTNIFVVLYYATLTIATVATAYIRQKVHLENK